jgi:DNA-binding NarL/FixJ family response regulator
LLQELDRGVNGSIVPRASGTEPGSERTISTLIADDAASTRHFIRSVLERSGQFAVIGEASDGDETVEMAEALQPDVVLLDLGMPLAYGTSALRRIRVVAPEATVIVVSALDPALQIPTLEAGAVAFIPKGFTPLEFLERLGAILDRSLNPESRAEVNSISDNPRAVVFADEPATRHLVAHALDRCGSRVIAETDNSSTLFEVLERVKPEIVVLGLSVRGTHNISVVPEIRLRSPSSALIVYSARERWKNKPLVDDETAFVLRPRFRQLVEKIEGIVNTSSMVTCI